MPACPFRAAAGGFRARRPYFRRAGLAAPGRLREHDNFTDRSDDIRMSIPHNADATIPPANCFWRRLRANYRYSVLFNLAFALMETFVLTNSPGSFLENLLDSMCVGSLAYLAIYGTRLKFWSGKRIPGWWQLVPVIVVAIPLSQLIGMSLSRWLQGRPVPGLAIFASFNMTGTLLATAAGTLFFMNRGRMVRLQTEAAEERARAETVARQALQAQLQMLQAQIEPHMLFNTLANLQGLIAIDPPRAQLLLDQLIQYLRATLSSSRAERTTLGQEFALMQAYLQVMATRMGTRLSFAIDLPETLRTLSVPPMLLQPLVENAIQHGVEPKVDGGHIDVSAVQDGARLLLTVRDSGLGLDHPAHPGHGTQMALSNIRSRLTALYGERASFTLSAAPEGGAVAQLNLPLESA